MNGLITRLFCAECLPIMADYGCFVCLAESSQANSAVFYWLSLLHLLIG